MVVAKRTALLIAAILSFAVYLIPLWTPHAAFPLGPALLAALGEDGGFTLHLAVNLVAAVVLQSILAAVVYFFLRRMNWRRGLALLLAMPLLVVLAELTFLLAVPAATLVDWRTIPERDDWPVACQVEGASLWTVFRNGDLALEQAGETWATLPGDDPAERVLATLTMPDCAVTERIRVTKFSGSSRNTFGSNGAALYWAGGHDGADETAWVLGPKSGAAAALDPPPQVKYWQPILSRDASAIAWVEPQGGGVYHLVWRDLDSGLETRLDWPSGQSAWREVLAFDRAKGEILLRSGRDQALVLDLNGQMRRGPITLPSGLETAYHFRWGPSGWASDSGHPDPGERAVIGWDLGGHTGLYSVSKGLGVSSLSLSPDGRYIAFSSDQTLSLFPLDSTVTVLDSRDGSVVFHRDFPTYNRATVAFLGDRYFAFDYSRSGSRTVEVLQLP